MRTGGKGDDLVINKPKDLDTDMPKKVEDLVGRLLWEQYGKIGGGTCGQLSTVIKELSARCCTIPVGSRTDPSPV